MDVKEAESILFRAWDRVCAREQKSGFGNLRRAEQVFVSIWMLEAEVNNGGFSQYMFNSAGDQGEFVLEALREVGAGPVAETCEQFYVMLPGGRPARTQDERQAQLDSAAVEIRRHYGAGGPAATREGKFLGAVARRLYDEDVFSVVLTPAFDELHRSHFHFDDARYRVDGAGTGP